VHVPSMHMKVWCLGLICFALIIILLNLMSQPPLAKPPLHASRVSHYENQPMSLSPKYVPTQKTPSAKDTDEKFDFSSHHCIGVDFASRYCLFKHIYYDQHTNNFLYIVPKSQPRFPVLYERNGSLDDFPTEIVSFQAKFKKFGALPFSLVTVSEVPRSKLILHYPGYSVLWQEINEKNYGHFISDTLFPLFMVLYDFSFSLETLQQFQVLIVDHCMDRNLTSSLVPFNCPPQPNCTKERFLERYLTVFENQVKCWRYERLIPARVSKRYLHFPVLAIGGGGLATRPSEVMNEANQGRSVYWWKFRQHIVSRVGGLITPPSKHKVVLVNKWGKGRKILNIEVLYKFLRETLPCEVVMYGGGLLSTSEEIILVSSATVFITPPGGISFSIPFLPRGAAVILVAQNTFGNRKTGVGFIESDVLWRRLAYVRVFHYEAEPEINENDPKGSDVKVVPEKLLLMVNKVLLESTLKSSSKFII